MGLTKAGWGFPGSLTTARVGHHYLAIFTPRTLARKAPAVGGFFDDFCGRFAGAVTGFVFDQST